MYFQGKFLLIFHLIFSQGLVQWFGVKIWFLSTHVPIVPLREEERKGGDKKYTYFKNRNIITKKNASRLIIYFCTYIIWKESQKKKEKRKLWISWRNLVHGLGKVGEVMDCMISAMDDIYSWLSCFPMGWYDKNAFRPLAENIFLKAQQELSGRVRVIYWDNWRSMWYEECMLHSHHQSTTFFLSFYFLADPVICLIYQEENFIQLFSYNDDFHCKK